MATACTGSRCSRGRTNEISNGTIRDIIRVWPSLIDIRIARQHNRPLIHSQLPQPVLIDYYAAHTRVQ